MNYAIIENESVCRSLEDIASWMREKDDDISPKTRKRLDKLAKKIESCSSELEAIVADHYKEDQYKMSDIKGQVGKLEMQLMLKIINCFIEPLGIKLVN